MFVAAGSILRRHNIEHRTSNVEHRTKFEAMPHWELDVGCSVLDVFLLFGSGLAGLGIKLWTESRYGAPHL
jgi:hypothetical protein